LKSLVSKPVHLPSPHPTLANASPDATGSQTATKAIIDIYDIFGPAPQTLQGADLLAQALNALVLVPDFLEGEYAQGAWFHNPTEEQAKLKSAFMARAGKFGELVQKLGKVVEEGKEKWAGVKGWGTFGLCWGGKVS